MMCLSTNGKGLTGARVLGIVYIIEGLIIALASFLGIKGIDFKGYSTIPPMLSLSLIIEEGVLGFLGLLGGIGVIRLFQWGRKILITVAIFSIILLITTPLQIGLFAFKSFVIFSYLKSLLLVMLQSRFEILFYMATIYYFTRPKVKEQFK